MTIIGHLTSKGYRIWTCTLKNISINSRISIIIMKQLIHLVNRPQAISNQRCLKSTKWLWVYIRVALLTDFRTGSFRARSLKGWSSRMCSRILLNRLSILITICLKLCGENPRPETSKWYSRQKRIWKNSERWLIPHIRNISHLLWKLKKAKHLQKGINQIRHLLRVPLQLLKESLKIWMMDTVKSHSASLHRAQWNWIQPFSLEPKSMTLQNKAKMMN